MGELQSEDSAHDMSIWFTTPETTPRKTAPCEALVRFVAKNFKPPARFLDIGSGDGADSRYLDNAGFRVVSIDISLKSRGGPLHAVGDIRNIHDWGPEQFDCIIDIETLQHVKDPPYEGIYRALKPGGKFFSIHIASDSEVDVAGKGYTRLLNNCDVLKLLKANPWFPVIILKSTNWSGCTKISCWQIEATKAGIAQ